MDLGVAGGREEGPAAVTSPCCGDVAAFGIGGQVVHVAVATSAEHHSVCGVGFELAVFEIADNDPTGRSVDNDEIQHFAAGKHFHFAHRDLSHECLIGTQQQLLAGLAAAVERSRQLSAPEGSVGERSTVLPREGNPFNDTLID